MKTIVGGNDVVPGCGPRTSAGEALEVTEAAWHSTAQLAYDLWERRGRPLGSPEVDWFAAEKALSTPVSTDKKTKATPGNKSTRSQSAA
jgi:hypothetical protein